MPEELKIGAATWALVCEVAAGLLDAQCLASAKILKSIAALAPDDRAARQWAATRFHSWAGDDQKRQRVVLYQLLQRGVGRSNSDVKAFQADLDAYENDEQMAKFCAEFLVACRHPHRTAKAALCAERQIENPPPTVLDGFWIAHAQATASGVLAALDAALAKLSMDDNLRWSLARHLLRRLFAWPLFWQGGRRSGLSVPVGVYVTLDDCGGTWFCTETVRNESGNIPQDSTRLIKPSIIEIAQIELSAIRGIDPSLVLAHRAARDAWRSKHGRIPERERIDVVGGDRFQPEKRGFSATFDFTLTARALRLLGLDSAFGLDGSSRALLDFKSTPQRSLEAYLAQALLAALLHRPQGAQTSVTGTLEPPRNGLAWGVSWVGGERADDLVEMMLGKARHAGGATAYARVVVPGALKSAYRELAECRHSNGITPHIIGVTNLPRCADLCLVGPWRPGRTVRCDHLAVDSAADESNPTKGDREDVQRFAKHLRASLSPGLFVVARDSEVAARGIVEHLRATNAPHLAALRHTISPSQIGWLVFRAMPNESGGAFLASLLGAISGQPDGGALARVDNVYNMSSPADMSTAIVELVAEWLNHTYSGIEPWHAPEIAVFYGLEHQRSVSEAQRILGGDPCDAWRLLLDLPSKLQYCPVAEHRERDLGRTRLVVIGDTTPEHLPAGWEVFGWEAAPVAPAIPTWPRDKWNVAGYLSLFRIPTPAVTLMSALRALEADIAAIKAAGTEAVLYRKLRVELSEIAGASGSHGAVSSRGLFGLAPEISVAARRLVDECPPTALLRAHLAVSASYAPWLRLDSLLNIPGFRDRAGRSSRPTVASIPTPSDEWFLPERLTEVEYHLNEARRLSLYGDYSLGGRSTLSGLVNVALERLTNVSYFDRPNRIQRLLHCRRDGTSARREWKQFASSKAAGGADDIGRLPLTTILTGLRCIVTAVQFVSERDKNQRQCVLRELREILSAISDNVRTRGRPGPGGRILADGLVALGRAYAACHEQATVPTMVLPPLEAQLQVIEAAGGRLDPGGGLSEMVGTMFEAVGDAFVAAKRLKDAQTWYARGSRHAPTHPLCAVKHDAIERRRTAVSAGLTKEQWDGGVVMLAKADKDGKVPCSPVPAFDAAVLQLVVAALQIK